MFYYYVLLALSCNKAQFRLNTHLKMTYNVTKYDCLMFNKRHTSVALFIVHIVRNNRLLFKSFSE